MITRALCAVAVGAATLLTSSARGEDLVPAAPTATFVFSKGAKAVGIYDESGYRIFQGGQCKTPAAKGSFGWYTWNSRTHSVAAGVPSVVQMQLDLNFANKYCMGITNFVPLSGHTYDVAIVDRNINCRMQIIDRETGAPPPDAVVKDKATCADPDPVGKSR